MTLSLVAIKQHMMQVKIASISSLCVCLNAEPGLLRQMLGHWIRKGCIRQCVKTSACGGSCTKCDAPIPEIYEWVV
jgi:hypothetical protein